MPYFVLSVWEVIKDSFFIHLWVWFCGKRNEEESGESWKRHRESSERLRFCISWSETVFTLSLLYTKFTTWRLKKLFLSMIRHSGAAVICSRWVKCSSSLPLKTRSLMPSLDSSRLPRDRRSPLAAPREPAAVGAPAGVERPEGERRAESRAGRHSDSYKRGQGSNTRHVVWFNRSSSSSSSSWGTWYCAACSGLV